MLPAASRRGRRQHAFGESAIAQANARCMGDRVRDRCAVGARRAFAAAPGRSSGRLMNGTSIAGTSGKVSIGKSAHERMVMRWRS